MFDSISLQPAGNITEVKNQFIVYEYSKYNNYSNIIIFGTKYELFRRPYQITFSLAFGQANFFNYHILMTFLITYNFVAEKSLNNIPYRTRIH